MPLTPAEVHNVAFKKPPIGKRGYDEEEVDSFLDKIEAELARLIEENNDLRSRAEGAGSELTAPSQDGAGSDGAPQQLLELQQELADARRELQQAQDALAQAQQRGDGAQGEPHTRAVGVLELAQQTADQHVSQAKAEADRMLTEARQEADRQLSEAREEAERTLADASLRSTQQLSDADTRARQLDEDSSSRAARAVQEAEQRAATISAQFEQRKAALARQVEELRAFEREYRTRLRSYLESQLRDLDAGRRAEPVGAADGQHG
jgi:DivIVA domain-containing protein